MVMSVTHLCASANEDILDRILVGLSHSCGKYLTAWVWQNSLKNIFFAAMTVKCFESFKCHRLPFFPCPVLQYPASPGLLPSLHSELQRPAGSGCGSRCDRLILSSSGPGRPACGLGPLPGLPKPPGAPGLHLQTARSPAANHYPTDVPGILRHGQFLCASLMISALLFHFACQNFAKQVLFRGILDFSWFNLIEILCTILNCLHCSSFNMCGLDALL